MLKVSNEALIGVVEVYNNEGRTAAYNLLRRQYGVKNPYFIKKRIAKDPRFEYDPERDCYLVKDLTETDHLFMSIEELCSPVLPQRIQTSEKHLIDNRSADMEKLIQELLGDRLLELSRFITLDSLSKTMIIDHTSLKSAGYRVVTH